MEFNNGTGQKKLKTYLLRLSISSEKLLNFQILNWLM